MIIFWILAGGLVAMALAFILIPLLSADHPVESPAQDALNLEVFRQRLQELDSDLASGFLDQEQYDAAKHDLERDLLHDLDGKTTITQQGSPASRWLLGGVLLIAVPAASLYLYLLLGVPEIIDRLQVAPTAQNPAGAGAKGQATPSMDELITRLEERLKEDPSNLEGWLMLGRTYFATDRPEQGLAAVEKAYKLAPDNTDVMLAYAEAIAATSPNRSLDGRPAELIQAALNKAPKSPAARWLGGMLAFQHGDYQAAADGWKTILAELDPTSDEAKNLQKMIDQAHARNGQEAATGSADAAPTSPPAANAPETGTKDSATAAAASIQVDVKLDPGLAAQAKPEDSVFVFARAASGPPMPLAAKRLQVKDLPASVTLDDSMAMMPAMRLSAFDQVVVGARVSKAGEAMPQSGDLEAETKPFERAGQPKVEILIDRVRP